MSKKYLLLAILMTLSIFVQAQSKRKKSKQKATYAIGISGGYFSHGKMFENSENDFTGLSTFEVEIEKFFKARKSGFSITYLSRKSEYKPSIYIVDESRSALMINYNLMYNIVKSENKTGLYLGGFVGALFDRGKQFSRANLSFPFYTTYLALWTGPKAEYLYQMNSKIAFSVGAQLGLLEFGRQTRKRDDPSLPESVQSKSETYFSFAQRTNLNLGFYITL